MYRNQKRCPAWVVILAALVVSGVSHAGITELPTVALGDIPTELTALDPSGVLHQVRVYACDREPYATFFFQTAVVQGTAVLADTLTSRFGRALAIAAGEAVDVSQDPGQWPDAVEKVARNPDTHPDALTSLRQEGARLEAMIGPMARAAERTPQLIGQLPGLAQQAPGDFSGWTGKVKCARVVNSLRGSAGQLQNSVTSSARALGNIRGIVEALHR